MPCLLDDDDIAAAAARYEAANGVSHDPKVTPLRKRGRPRKSPSPAPDAGLARTPEQERQRLLALHNLEPLRKAENLPPYDVTSVTRYKAVPQWEPHKNPSVSRIWHKYRYMMPEHGLTPSGLKLWREHVVYMSVEQVAQLVRVDARTVRNWESGKSAIPFSMWWVMHATMQDPSYFLDRPGFHDFYIEFDQGRQESLLCSYSWPDIRVSPTDLYIQRAATSRLFSLESALAEKQRELDELTAENTRLRQMLKAGTVAQELADMHAHIGNLLAKMHTADVVEFPSPETRIAATGG